MAKVAETYNVTLNSTTPYRPQANPTERVNRVLKTMISCYMSRRCVDRDIHLQDFAYAMNTAVHSAVGYTLAYLNFGRELLTL
jgi:hypothetical protein